MNNIKSYGKVRLIRPYEFDKYVKYIKLLNIVLAFVIPILYPIPIAVYLNKYIRINNIIRW